MDAGGRMNQETESRTPEATVFMDELYAAGAWMRRSSDLRPGLFFFIFLIFISSLVSAESLREFHQRKCNEGNKDSCGRATDMLEGEQHAERIVQLGDHFAAEVDRSVLEEDRKPILSEAYLDVLDDYFKAEAENGIKQAVADEMIKLCAEHYHDHWRNRKMWWPTDDEGKPDWSTIYYYIVDHYYGYCLRSAL
jgi:hypothetical protein